MPRRASCRFCDVQGKEFCSANWHARGDWTEVAVVSEFRPATCLPESMVYFKIFSFPGQVGLARPFYPTPLLRLVR